MNQDNSEYHAFETTIGWCAIVWRQAGIVGFLLPEADVLRLQHAILAQHQGAVASRPPTWVKDVIQRVQRHLGGTEIDDFANVPLDLTACPPFHQQVYQAVRRIVPGRTQTYGDIGAALGRPGGARAVGQAMRRNPLPLLIPCHRVLAAGAKPGGFSAHGGLTTKARMLQIEGVDLGTGNGLVRQPRMLDLGFHD